MSDWNISPLDLKTKLDRGEKPVLLDVREPWEYQLAHIDGSLLIPLNEIAARKEEIESETEVVILCHHGIRSLAALEYLRRQGFTNLKNLAGGIDAWSMRADPRVPRYR